MLQRHDPSSATCQVFTRKEGLLATMAHDLRIQATRFTVDVDEARGTVAAWWDATSLRVVCAQRHGVDDPDALSASDRARIDRALCDDVLDAARHPEARFHGAVTARDASGVTVDGVLSLHGTSRGVQVHAVGGNGSWTVSVTLHQPDWGMKPFTAMLGALKVHPDVVVTLRVGC